MEPNEPNPNPAIPLGLLDDGDPRFVAALRAVADSAALAPFAGTWYADTRPQARRLLLAYLDEPPNAPGHEGLVKRLFKLAEAAHDDAVMARFLVLGDRLIIRRRPTPDRYLLKRFATLEEAKTRGNQWGARGIGDISYRRDLLLGLSRQYCVTGRFPRTTLSARATTLPRLDWKEGEALAALTPDQIAQRRWFSVATRRYLQRRVWRYFRTLGRTDPNRYVAAAVTALGLYRDAELGDGIALLEHFGLIHLLFEGSPALWSQSSGWDLVPGHTLAELVPSPAFEAAWLDRPEAVSRVLDNARTRVIARWAVRRIEVDRERFAAMAQPADWVNQLDRDDPEVVGLALAILAGQGVDRLRREIAPERWASAAELAAPGNRAAVCDFVARMVRPDEISRADAVRLAVVRAEPLARLGWSWIEGQGVAVVPPGADPEADATRLLELLDAECVPLRPMILRGVRAGLAGRAGRQVNWIWAMLDSRHADARAEGWAWFRSDDLSRNDPDLWARLLDSPYPDIRAGCSTVVEPPTAIDLGRLGSVWASVLLESRGLARIKPGVIRRVTTRLVAIATDPEREPEVESLLDLLAAVVRSARSPERRGALAALVTLAERRPEWRERIEGLVPTLHFAAEPGILPA